MVHFLPLIGAPEVRRPQVQVPVTADTVEGIVLSEGNVIGAGVDDAVFNFLIEDALLVVGLDDCGEAFGVDNERVPPTPLTLRLVHMPRIILILADLPAKPWRMFLIENSPNSLRQRISRHFVELLSVGDVTPRGILRFRGKTFNRNWLTNWYLEYAEECGNSH